MSKTFLNKFNKTCLIRLELCYNIINKRYRR
nr:MAG TPA: hypothetical protein [Caudoviricetes sp.]